MELIAIFIGIGVLFFIVSMNANDSSASGSLIILREEVLKNKDFQITQEYLDNNTMKYIALDEKNHKICLLHEDSLTKGKYLTNIYTYSDILESEIIENGVSISKMSKSSVAGRALLGGLLLGGVGAVIGGFTADRSEFENMKRISLRIVVNNTTNPLFEIDFFNNTSGEGIKKDSFMYSNMMGQATHWHNLFKVIIKKDDENISS
ncbi:hypothetical protein [Poseidonibacter ostreae]|uniref:Uncharacterized protein n=1 Tax=Poseidonibacter ostreae TaxID=2654171 RepID=A0ABQ6VPG0_9BACT|nr:hypothetical protein [Poseidonibacter ostreae]KAB7892594.1 hypothetical protein GBG18_01690 [Poseidonibacter ostreae]